MFLERVNIKAPSGATPFDPSHFVLQQLDYLEFIDLYHERIRCFTWKDAEFRPTGRQGVYGGYQSWANRRGRFSLAGRRAGDFKAIFSKLTQYGFDGGRVLEWECCIKSSKQGPAEVRHLFQAISFRRRNELSMILRHRERMRRRTAKMLGLK